MPEVNADQAEWAYSTILARLLELTSTLGDRSAPAVCAVVRPMPLRLLVGLMQDQDLSRRYAIELPLFLTDGTTVNWSRAIDAIRDVHLHRDEYLTDDRANYRFHGAPVVFGDRAVEFGGRPKPVEDTLYANLRFIGGRWPTWNAAKERCSAWPGFPSTIRPYFGSIFATTARTSFSGSTCRCLRTTPRPARWAARTR